MNEKYHLGYLDMITIAGYLTGLRLPSIYPLQAKREES